MIKLMISIDEKKWNVLDITKLVHKLGVFGCEIDLISGKRYYNMKSICSMLEFCEKIHSKKKAEICIDGDGENEVSSWLQEYFRNESI